jgi:PST family polysaccharide transporter
MSAARNARWIALAQVTRVVIQLVSIAVLGRLLAPSDFGYIAMLTVATNLMGLLRDMGTSSAIIQMKNVDCVRLSSIFWVNVGLGAILTVTLCISSTHIASLFNAPALVLLLIAVAPGFLINALGAVQKSLLERRSDFPAVTRIEVLGALTGAATTIGAASLGAGAMSWPIGSLVTAIQTSFNFWKAETWRPTWQLDFAEIKALFHFSGNLTAFNLVNYFSRNADSFIVGRYLGSDALGIYSAAYRIMLFPVQNLTFVAIRALYPLMSSRQDERSAMASLYMKSLATVAFFSAPLMMAIYLLHGPLVRVLMGPRWGEAAELLRWLAPIGYIQSILSTTGTVFMASGRTDILLRLGLLGTVLFVSSFIVGLHWGVQGVAQAYLVANILAGIPAFVVTLRQLHFGVGVLIKALRGSALSACAMGVALEILLRTTSLRLQSDWLVLMVLSPIGGAIYLLIMWKFYREHVRLATSLLPSRLTAWSN